MGEFKIRDIDDQQLAKLDEMAKRRGMSRNAFLLRVVDRVLAGEKLIQEVIETEGSELDSIVVPIDKKQSRINQAIALLEARGLRGS